MTNFEPGAAPATPAEQRRWAVEQVVRAGAIDRDIISTAEELWRWVWPTKDQPQPLAVMPFTTRPGSGDAA